MERERVFRQKGKLGGGGQMSSAYIGGMARGCRSIFFGGGGGGIKTLSTALIEIYLMVSIHIFDYSLVD